MLLCKSFGGFLGAIDASRWAFHGAGQRGDVCERGWYTRSISDCAYHLLLGRPTGGEKIIGRGVCRISYQG